jgi:hypothetical protein
VQIVFSYTEGGKQTFAANARPLGRLANAAFH